MINADKLKQLKELLDTGAITQEEFEQQKAQAFAENKKALSSEKIKIIIGILVVVIICFSMIGSCSSSVNDTTNNTEVSDIKAEVKADVPQEFAEDCPISISASIYDNIIGVPEISCSMKNKTDKEILAIQLYFSPRDVYGEDVNTIFTTNNLQTDTPISPNGSVSRTWQLLDTDVKSGDLIVYSVFFEDGSEWGNKDAATSDIKKYGHKITIKY